MKKKIKNNHAPILKPIEGMTFRENVKKNPRTAVLVKRRSDRVWMARNELSGYPIYIPVAKMHIDPYADGWSLVNPADALPENFGMIEVKGNF